MSDADCSSVDIDLVHVDVKVLDIGEDDDTEGLVDLPHVNILLLHPRHLQHLVHI